jgi:hypothetical protein
MSWSRKYKECIECGIVDVKHAARSFLCKRYYDRNTEKNIYSIEPVSVAVAITPIQIVKEHRRNRRWFWLFVLNFRSAYQYVALIKLKI